MDTLTQIWTTYKGEIIPALISAVLLFIPFISFWIKNRLSIANKKAEIQVELLKQVVNKEDTRPELDVLSEEITCVKNELSNVTESISNLANIFNETFQKSDLDIDTKELINSLTKKVIVGSNQEKIVELQKVLESKTDEIVQLKNALTEKAKVKVEEIKEKVKRIRG